MANDFDLGKSTSYAYYVSEGGTKTPKEFGEMLVNIDTVASRAEESASDAEESATSANESKETAVGSMNVAIAKANEASASADIAVNKAGEASASATVATNKANEASASATTASAKATESSQNALTAVGAKNDAVSAKNDAVTAKTQAQSAKDDAVSAKLGAESARDEVQSSADQITQNASDITQLKSELSDIPIHSKSFSVPANTNHSSNNDTIPISVKTGEAYAVEVETTASNVLIYAKYTDGTDGAVNATGTAAKDINAFGIFCINNTGSAIPVDFYAMSNVFIETQKEKVSVIPQKTFAIYKGDPSLESGSIQWGGSVSALDDAVGYTGLLYLNGPAKIEIRPLPLYTGITSYKYRFIEYKNDGTYQQVISTTDTIWTVHQGYTKFRFGIYAMNGDSYAGVNLYNLIDVPILITVQDDSRKEYYIGYDELPDLMDNVNTNANNILSFNRSAKDALLQAKRPINLSSNAYKSAVQPVALLHFSDIHADEVELKRMIEFLGKYSGMIDDAICTGDIVNTRWSNGIDFWTNTDGAEKVLIAIGNHDVLTDPSGYDWTQLATQSDQYDRYIAPFVANWGVTSESGKTYYYKDYTAKKLRLIVLNCMLTGDDETAQLSWLATTLAGAKTSDYSVVIANHMMIESAEKIECNFSTLDKSVSGTGNVLSSAYESAVKDFIDGGGKFVCHIAGHTHWDMIVKGTNDYSNQLCVNVDALSRTQGNQYSDTQRTDGTKSQDLANLFVIDTASGVVKIIRIGANMDHYLRVKDTITINYGTQAIVSQN